jgi:hypothetical protein
MRLRILALFLSVVLSAIAASAQSRQTLTGTVSEAMCASHDARPDRNTVYPRMRQTGI